MYNNALLYTPNHGFCWSYMAKAWRAGVERAGVGRRGLRAVLVRGALSGQSGVLSGAQP